MRTLDVLLTDEQKEAGLYLTEDDHNLYLMKRGEPAPLAVFSATTVLISEIVDQAEQHLQWLKSGVSFGRVV